MKISQVLILSASVSISVVCLLVCIDANVRVEKVQKELHATQQIHDSNADLHDANSEQIEKLLNSLSDDVAKLKARLR